MNDYRKFTFLKSELTELQYEILMADLADIGFESFDETDTTYHAYIQESLYEPNLTLETLHSQANLQLSDTSTLIKGENWNQLWESNFEPVVVDHRCVICAPFHKNVPDANYQLLVAPQMAFGTGHHETTYLVIQNMLDLDITDLDVLDMGCGTAILAILAAKMGARSVLAIDNDPQATTNAQENIELNPSVTNLIQVQTGDAHLINRQFHLILANINRNILLTDMHAYAQALHPKGILIMSGFYEHDVDLLDAEARSLQLTPMFRKSKNQWACLGMVNC